MDLLGGVILFAFIVGAVSALLKKQPSENTQSKCSDDESMSNAWIYYQAGQHDQPILDTIYEDAE